MSDMFNLESSVPSSLLIPNFNFENKKILQNKNNDGKYIKKVLDAYQYNYNEFRKYKEQIVDNNKPWNFYNVRMDFSRRLVKNSDGYFEIPIFIKMDVKDIEWILSHEVTDIIRIMIENKLKILENGKIIKDGI
jgi:hypothetical protein